MRIFFVLVYLTVCTNLNAQTFTDAEDLADAVNASTSGGVFIVKNGTYHDFEAAFEVVASENNPVIIKAETIGGVSLTGESHFVIKKSAHVMLEGFVFDATGEDTLVKLEGSNNVRITNNVFELATTESIKWVFIGGVWNDNTFPFEFPSHHNRVDHNLFQNKNTPGHYITVDGTFDDNGSEEVYYQSQYDRIDHNHFKNNGPRAVNEQESIRIGWSEMSMSSNGTRWDAPITLTLGDAIDGQSSNLSKHFRAEGVTIAFNTLVHNSHGIEIGFDNNDNYNKDLKDITIANNLITGSENSLVDIVDPENDQGDNILWDNNLLFPTDNATLLSGASITSFDSDEVVNENPFLEYDTTLKVWRTSATTPLYENTLNMDIVTEDIDGQARPIWSNPGADHFSLESVRFPPLTAADVGPAFGDMGTTSVEWEQEKEAFLAYPNPSNNLLHLQNIDPAVKQFELLNSNGIVIKTHQISNSLSDTYIDISALNNGIYYLRAVDGRDVEVLTIIIQH